MKQLLGYSLAIVGMVAASAYAKIEGVHPFKALLKQNNEG
jgi:hypothetical protein